MTRWLKSMLVASSVAFLAACGGGDDDNDTATVPNIVEIAQGDANFSTLAAAVVKADLAGTLSGNTPLTVFAPTNAAFDAVATAIGLADGAALVDALPADALAKILTYHVVAGDNPSTALTAGTLSTLYEFEGSATTLDLSLTGGVVLTDALLTTATVTTPDIDASNGVVHVIDKVLVPPGVLNIVQMAQLNPAFSTLVTAVVEADLAATLSGTGPFTVFAPTNEAFAAALAELGLTAEQLLASPDLAAILTYHVVGGDVRAADVVALVSGGPADVTTVQGDTFRVGTDLVITDGRSRTATLAATDVVASNGVIHVIDAVLLPPAP
jgi:transforming growth factor-beta-induced protein